jgi:peptidoglycan/LPS O-acetylase OafA/YrhL
MIAAAQTQWKGPRLLTPLLSLGRCSYEVYLTHMFVVFVFFAIFVKLGSPIWSVPLLFVVTVVVAVATGDFVARFFSEPLNRRLRERWSDGRREVGSTSVSPEAGAGS